PTVGGEVEFHARYNGNCLVNAFAAGIADTDKIFLSEAKGVGLPIVYLGAKTGRDGVGGATMASAEFDESIEEKRPTVQVGDPFTEKCLLEACLELMKTGAVIAIQDMGAAGLTCSAVEMGAKGDLGVELWLDKVPVREERMTAYEMMLSESQERMLMVLYPAKKDEAKAIFVKWGLDFAIVGKTTDDLRFRIMHQGEEVADLPIKQLGDEAPEYDRPWIEPGLWQTIEVTEFAEPEDYATAILTMLGSPNVSSRRWVWEQYDTLIQGNSLQLPGGDAGVIRVDGHETKALAFSSDVTPRYVEADPLEGGKQAVAECWRNMTATGALPLAATDNLNFGNPERPEIMGQFVKAIEGIGEACKYLDFPIVSGNVSLYNETNGEAILPTPTIAGVGILQDWSQMARVSTMGKGDAVFLLGGVGTHLGQSIFNAIINERADGPPPPVDLYAEKRNGDFVRSAIQNGHVTACHDLSDGGLVIALAEMCMASKNGMTVSVDADSGPAHAQLFGEDQARYLVTVPADFARFFATTAEGAGVPFAELGVVSGDALTLTGAVEATISIVDMQSAHESWFPEFMNRIAMPKAAE
ncbi:MAG: phosphoribosylformylglycinamidine synthase subunit PurL, partial [Pseudomonadota bacterium]